MRSVSEPASNIGTDTAVAIPGTFFNMTSGMASLAALIASGAQNDVAVAARQF
jgi:hypothetical protein